MKVNITGNAESVEQEAYVEYLQKKHNRKLESLNIEIDGEYANLSYKFSPVPFERIRRITGYLVGTIDYWNDAKKGGRKGSGEACLGANMSNHLIY